MLSIITAYTAGLLTPLTAIVLIAIAAHKLGLCDCNTQQDTEPEDDDNYQRDNEILTQLTQYMTDGDTIITYDDWDTGHICHTTEEHQHQFDTQGECHCKPAIIPIPDNQNNITWVYRHGRTST